MFNVRALINQKVQIWKFKIQGNDLTFCPIRLFSLTALEHYLVHNRLEFNCKTSLFFGKKSKDRWFNLQVPNCPKGTVLRLKIFQEHSPSNRMQELHKLKVKRCFTFTSSMRPFHEHQKSEDMQIKNKILCVIDKGTKVQLTLDTVPTTAPISSGVEFFMLNPVKPNLLKVSEYSIISSAA